MDVGSRLLDKKVGCISAKLASTSTNAGGEKVDVGGRENGMIEMVTFSTWTQLASGEIVRGEGDD